MKIRQTFLLFTLFLVLTYGCSKSVQQQTAEPNASEPKTILDEYTIGKTTKEEVLSKLGKPTGISVNTEKGEETLIFNKSHITGKAYAPFYFGRDRYRMKIYTFTFNKDGILIGLTSDEQHF